MKIMRTLSVLLLVGAFGLLTACDDDSSSNNTSNVNNTSNTNNVTCGNGVIDTGEACDDTDLNGATCESEGYSMGTLACGANCQLDTTGCCTDACTDGNIVCSGNTLRVCEVGAAGCTEWVDTDCTTGGQICDDTLEMPACVDDVCTSDCSTEGDTRCDGANIQTCTQVGDCLMWNLTDTCAGDTPICNDDSMPARCEGLYSGDTCADAIPVTLPFTLEGTDFAADFTDSVDMYGNPGCSSYSSTTKEAIFQVTLTADATLLIEENGTFDAVIRVVDVCDATGTTCFVNDDDGSTDSVIFSAAAGTYFVIFEAYSSYFETGTYSFNITKLDATETDCADGVDNDGNGDVDCDDAACFGVGSCTTETDCGDGLDNDADGDIDCADTDCSGVGFCGAENTDTACSDGEDNDGDGLVDCADTECTGVGYCGLEDTDAACDDGEDNDGDGLVDCDDSDCDAASVCQPISGIYEQWTSGGSDLAGMSISFIPDGAGDYTFTTTEDATYMVTPGTTTGATSLTAGDQVYVELALPFTFNFYGTDYNSVWFSSNGFLSFDALSSSLDYESVSSLFSGHLIAFGWDDLTTNGTDPYWFDFGNTGSVDWVALTFSAQEWNNDRFIDVQVVLWADGRIDMHYITMEIDDCIVGISKPGIGTTPDPVNFFGTTILSETFDGTEIPMGWTVVDSGDATGDSWANLGGYMRVDYNSSAAQDEALVSPVMDLSMYSTKVMLTYDVDYDDYSSSDYLDVDVSVDGVNWTTVKTYDVDSVSTDSVDITAVAAGQSMVWVRFHYIGDNDWHAEIDNVMVEAL